MKFNWDEKGRHDLESEISCKVQPQLQDSHARLVKEVAWLEVYVHFRSAKWLTPD